VRGGAARRRVDAGVSRGARRSGAENGMSPRRSGIDGGIERQARGVARRTDRRGFLARLATLIVGAAALPLLPVARGFAAPGEPAGAEGDPKRCEYWRHCAIDGFLCSCCGGSQTACPPGTEMSPVTWIRTGRNPADGKD